MKVADRETCNKHWTAALPSRLTFTWMRGLLVQGWKKPLEMSDIGDPPQVYIGITCRYYNEGTL